MKSSLALTSLLITLLAGCAHPTAFTTKGVPAPKYLVGGGLDIEYVAPSDGTAYWVEETTSKIVKTVSLQAGDSFEVSVDEEEGTGNLQQMLGISVSDARFSLYFVPTKPTGK